MSKILPAESVTTKLSKDAQMEVERMHDVTLLLERLALHDETTVRLVMANLYDIGSVRLANEKFAHPTLNQLARAMSRMSKPVFLVFAVRWFQKDCPKLIADWLYTVATFQVHSKPVVPPETLEVMQQLEASQRQVKALQTKVRYLTGAAVGLVLILGGALATTTNLIPSTVAEVINPDRLLRPLNLELANQSGN